MGSVLVVDDDADAADAMRLLLARGGHGAASASGGAEALNWLAAQPTPPDVIVLDWMMPLVGGADVLRTIRADPAYRNVRVLIFSAAYENELVRTARLLGADDYVGKGTIAPGEVVKRIEALMNQAAGGGNAATPGAAHDLAGQPALDT